MINLSKLSGISLNSNSLISKKRSSWKKFLFKPKFLVKGIVPNSPGIYMLFSKNNQPLYVGHSSILRHRIQSYYQDDCFKEHPTKKKLRSKIGMFAYKIMPEKEAQSLERQLKKRMRFNYL